MAKISDGRAKCARAFVQSVLCAMACVAAGLVVPAPVHAGMTVVPSKIELTATPGSYQTKDVRAINTNPNPLKLTLSVWDFARDESGRAHPIGPKDVKQFRGMASWVSLDESSFIVPSGKTGVATLNVQVPQDAEPGGHYTYVTFRGVPVIGKKKGVVMPVAYNISALLVVELPGGGDEPPVLRQAVKIADLTAPRVSFGGEVPLEIYVQNSGNVHVNFKGKVKLSKGMYQINSSEVPEYTLLPYSKMNIIQSLGGGLPFGYYEASVVGDIGLDKPVIAKTGFWVVPVPVLLWSLAALLVLIALIVLLRGRVTFVRKTA